MKTGRDREKPENQPIRNRIASNHLHQGHFYFTNRYNLEERRAMSGLRPQAVWKMSSKKEGAETGLSSESLLCEQFGPMENQSPGGRPGSED
jgi:hypothetical protein